MMDLNFQVADWKTEKHVPVIDSADVVKKGEAFKITVTVGKEIPHPNTTEHHISCIGVYFIGDGEKFPSQVGRFEFSAHGESTQGPNLGLVYTNPEATLNLRIDKTGTIFAISYCNIHGLWKSAKEIRVEG